MECFTALKKKKKKKLLVGTILLCYNPDHRGQCLPRLGRHRSLPPECLLELCCSVV